MNNFVYDIPTRVYFGENQLGNLGAELSKYGKKVLMTYGGGSIKKIGLYDKIVAELQKAGLELFELTGIDPNPRVSSVNAGADICKKEEIDVLLAVGGGSVLDCTKYIGAATYYDGDAWDILLQKVPVEKCLPIITVLTLAATGSEMDAGGVISNLETKDKIGLIFPVMQPKVSFLDPTATYTVNEFQTACGAADMLNHILEVYFNMNQDLYMLDYVMEGLMKTIIKYTPIALEEPDNYEARANLMWTSTWAINGFINGGKRQAWSCHPMEHELSAIYDITHGLGLAILTPRWMEYTLDETTVSKFYQFGTNVFGIDKNLEPVEVAKKSIELVSDFLFGTLGLQSTFTEIGIDETNFEIMAKKACMDGVLPGFKPLNQQDIVNIFKMCL
ncbi:MAG: butanol dehydrogenase [Herbinix sp.]|jgi:alcohol dehydrogenase YqhD (iron-dependent ADH family)|nr:butanol dehydrogenase [Herbinix sp.]